MNPDLPLPPFLTPDRERAARVVARCRQRLERRAERLPTIVVLERAIVSGFALVYVGAVVIIIMSIPAIR